MRYEDFKADCFEVFYTKYARPMCMTYTILNFQKTLPVDKVTQSPAFVSRILQLHIHLDL